MAFVNLTSSTRFDKLTDALAGLELGMLNNALECLDDRMTPAEVTAVYIAHWALNCKLEDELDADKSFDYSAQLTELYTEDSTGRELRFLDWAECCLEAMLPSSLVTGPIKGVDCICVGNFVGN